MSSTSNDAVSLNSLECKPWIKEVLKVLLSAYVELLMATLAG